MIGRTTIINRKDFQISANLFKISSFGSTTQTDLLIGCLALSQCNLNKPYEVKTDASNYVGVVLNQDWTSVAFESKKLPFTRC